VATREPIQKPEPFKKQPKLFEDKVPQPTKWSPYINRDEIDKKARVLKAQKRATYTKNYNSLTCHLCGETTNHMLQVNNNYCMSCDVLHDIDYADNQ
jgi:hypothetical protein